VQKLVSLQDVVFTVLD